jgi:hypothetical protein
MASRRFLISAAAATFSAAVACASEGELREYRTGHTFKLRRAAPPSPDSFLLSCNTRCMLGWCRFPPARAYAFGLYLDAQTLAAAGAMKRAGAGEGDPAALVASLLDAAEGASRRALAGGASPAAPGAPRVGSLSIVLVIARAIDGPHMARGFHTSMLSRYQAALKRRGGAPEEGVLAELGALSGAFSGLNLAVGDEVCFVWDAGGDGALRATLNGAALPGAELRSAGLARALFEVYAGEGGVSARAVNTLRANLASACVASGAREVEGIVRAEHASSVK